LAARSDANRSDPDRVVIKHSGELKHAFACGEQKPFHMVVDYAILPDAKLHSAGIVRGLDRSL
jgi:hypothetical protein